MIDPDIMNNTYKCSWCDTTFPNPYYASLDNAKHYLEKEDIMMHKVCMQDMDWWMTEIDPKTKTQFIAPFFPSSISYELNGGINIDGRTGLPVNDRQLIKTRKNWIMGDGYFGYKKVIFNPPATIVIWNDNTKTVVKCGPNDYYDPEKGLALCFMKRAFKNDNNAFHKVFNKALKEGSMEGYTPFPMTPVEFDEFYGEYLKLKEDKDEETDL